MRASINKPHLFGVRHLSPAGALHLVRFLDRVKPSIVLIEGIADATALIPDIVDKRSRPPLAILSYTDRLPVRSFVTPFAVYSPEFQALKWAKANRKEARFIDLPSSVFLALQGRDDTNNAVMREDDASSSDTAPDGEVDSPVEDELEEFDSRNQTRESSIYEDVAARAGEPDYETYWERRFEHNLQDDSYRKASRAFGCELRISDPSRDDEENGLREAYMRRQIAQAVEDGHAPEKIVVVVGAFHIAGLEGELPPMSEQQWEAAPKVQSKLTLMPYSYFRLSSQSGYGAGNHAPAYFELMWECLQSERTALPALYLTTVARDLRARIGGRSSAEVIEATRLASALAALRCGYAPTLADLHDSASVLLGEGSRKMIAESLVRADVGTAIGALASGVSQTSIQEDFGLQLARLKLTDFRTTVARDLRLDLREDRRVKSEASAFLDLNRSTFLHRLAVLNISFASYKEEGSSQHSWSESWVLKWSTEAEIVLVESVLLGESVEVAAAYALARDLGEAKSIREAATVVQKAGECGIPTLIIRAIDRVQQLANEGAHFVDLARAAMSLAAMIRFGDVRRIDTEPLKPLLTQLFLQAALQLLSTAGCDKQTAVGVLSAMSTLDSIAQEHHALVDEQRWISELRRLSDADDRNALLSGYSCALLCERGGIDDDELAQEVSRRLSPGIEADLGAGWFEGLAKRNRYALLTRLPLWGQLANYTASLSDQEFTRALVFLRRGFSEFTPRERRSIAENLGEIWGVSVEQASEVLTGSLNEDEQASVAALDDFDFEDL